MNTTILKNCKAVFFDLYGTLLNYNDMEKSNQVWVNAFHQLAGIPNGLSSKATGEICEKILWEDLEKNSKETLTTYETKIQSQFEKYGITFNRDQLRHIADITVQRWQDNISLFEDVIPVLQKLKQHKKLALISNFDHTPHVKKVIAKHELDKYFDLIIISDEVGYTKPDPQIFQLALKQTKLNPNEVIFVGDSYSDDILGAQSANILPVMIKHKSALNPNNQQNQVADVIIIQSLLELLELLS